MADSKKDKIAKRLGSTVKSAAVREAVKKSTKEIFHPAPTPTPEPRPLTAKQARFKEEYLIDNNATQAAIRAGYSEKTAQQIGSRLLSNVVVAKAIAEGQKITSNRLRVTVDDVVKALKGFAEDSAEATKDRVKCWDLLGKNLGMFNTIKIQGDAGNPIAVTQVTRRIVDGPRD